MQLAECIKMHANYSTIYTAIVEGHSDTCKTSAVNFADTFHDMRMSQNAVKSIKKAVNVILYLSRQAHYKAAYQAVAVKNAAKKEAAANVGCTTKRSAEVKEAAQRAVIRQKVKAQNSARKATRDRYLCTFITLTLPAKQTHTDVDITKYCVNPFLSYARKYWGVRHYIWKKELQGNGNLHYHFVTDRYVEHEKLREVWNRIVNQGVVKDNPSIAPFDYVDRYSAKMRALYAEGWNEDKMIAYAAQSPFVSRNTADDVRKFERENNRKTTSIEYQQIFVRNKFAELERLRNAYHKEMKLDPASRWTSPNSTDISAIRTPRSVSAYVAKYIAKDADDDPELCGYWEEVDHYKGLVKGALYDIAKKKDNGEPITELDYQAVQTNKDLLNDIRKNYCPIQGKLWFKSASLTPFLRGAGGCPTLSETAIKHGEKAEDGIIYTALSDEIKSLIDYLQYKERNSKTKKPKVIVSYGTKEDGTIDKDNIICITLLINVFELQMMRRGHRYQFPLLVGMWQRFIRNCKMQNLKRGLYRRRHATDDVFTNAA